MTVVNELSRDDSPLAEMVEAGYAWAEMVNSSAEMANGLTEMKVG